MQRNYIIVARQTRSDNFHLQSSRDSHPPIVSILKNTQTAY